MSKKKETTVKVDSEKKRISVEKDGKGIYIGGSGKAPSHSNPKGEKKVEVGVVIRFGGSSKKKK